MRTKIIIGVFLLFSEMMVGQTFRKAFDAYDNGPGINSAFSGQGQSMYSNTDIWLSGPGPGYLVGYLNMYKSTKDLKYIERFAIQAKRFMDRRDDNLPNICADPGATEFGYPYKANLLNGCSSTGTNALRQWNLLNGTSKSWCHNSKDGFCFETEHELAQDANILYPLVLFIYAMTNDPDFIGITTLPLPSEVSTADPSTLGNYGDLAYWLSFKCCETVDWWNEIPRFNNNVNVPIGTLNPTNQQGLSGATVTADGYINDDESSANTFGQVNMQASMGSVLILLDEIFDAQGVYAARGPGYYASQLDGVARFLKSQIIANPCFPYCLFWSSDYNPGQFAEDDSHAQATFRFAYLCNKFALPNGTSAYFNSTWIHQFAMTFATRIYEGPLSFSRGIAGADPCGVDGLDTDVSSDIVSPIIGGYTYYTEFNPYIYGIISDCYAYNSLYSPTYKPTNDPSIEGYSQLTLAENGPNLFGYTYINIFNPISVWPGASQHWAAVSGGDFLGNQNYEVATANIYNNTIGISAVDPISHMQTPVVSGSTVLANPVKFMASGKFLGVAGGPDALIAIDANGGIDIMQQIGSSISSIQNTGAPYQANFTVAAVAAGKFEPSNPADELLLLNQNGQFNLLKYLPNAPPGSADFMLVSTNLSVPLYQIGGMTAGHFDNTGALELAITDQTGVLNIYGINPGVTSISLLYSYVVPQPVGLQVQWDGITSGDFLGLGYDQVFAHSGYDGQFLLYQVDQNLSKITLAGWQAFPDGNNMPNGQTYVTGPGSTSSLNDFTAAQKWQNGLMACLKKCPGTGNAALVTLRNSDGQATIYDMEGNCQGLSVSNNYFYDETFPANNPVSLSPTPPPSYTGMSPTSNQLTGDNSDYPLDYHVARNLTASNDLVYPNTNVNFIAGNEVAMTGEMGIMSGSNFTARIDHLLSCNPDIVIPKSKTNHPGQMQTVLNPPFQSGHGNQLAVEPNPSTSLFVAHTTDGSTGQLYLYDMRGKLVYSNGDYSLSTWNLDLNSYPEGIYYIKVISNKGSVLTQKVIHQ